ncbi:hypothetical protein QQX98_001568 [Neonectria punicea]|uniref:HNH nuclease domain-containing protein n=1 Tax=Neonectria punicea TaxID=979145 RepID=A0ABR1HMU5_9HYPO
MEPGHAEEQSVRIPQQDSLFACLDRFLHDTATRPEDVRALRAFLRASPRRQEPTTSYIDNLETRIQLLRDIQRDFERHRGIKAYLTAALWSLFMVAPLAKVRWLRDQLHESPAMMCLFHTLQASLPVAMNLFFNKPISEAEIVFAGLPPTNNRGPPTEVPETIETTRNQLKKSQVVTRDGYCIITGTANPDICHVFPYAAKNAQTIVALQVLQTLWRPGVHERFLRLLMEDENIIDTAQNMVALSPCMHKLWRTAKFGLEPISKIEKGIRVRFRWLHRTGLTMKNQVQLDLDPRMVLQTGSNSIPAAQNSKTFRPVLDGEMIDITAKDKPSDPDGSAPTYDESTVPNWDVFCLQWDLVRIASLCGAGEEVDEDVDSSDSDDDGDTTEASYDGDMDEDTSEDGLD